jgi:hypothetical protein
MTDPQKALETQLANIETRTGKSLAELTALVLGSGLSKHGEIRSMLQETLGLGYGDANTLVHVAKNPTAPATSPASDAAVDDAANGLYIGKKADLRPIHDALMAQIAAFGDFEVAPKKTYLSLRRKKQFAMVGPATNTRVEVGLNAKGLPADERLIEMPAGSMCRYKVHVTSAAEVDDELLAWVRRAYDESG